ncbi:MAG TPA: hypothetical protein VJI52_05405 [Candidatus Nanoarchaeia archaeon]|nr:hypothetical protein [Candidatus Nanoarchaeia archaeon]
MSLEAKVGDKESNGFLKKALKLGFYTAVATASGGLSYGLVGFSGPLTGIAFGAGTAILNAIGKNPDKKSRGLEGLLKDFSVGSLTGIAGVWSYQAAASYFPVPGIGRALFGLAVANPIFDATYLTTDYIIKNDFNAKGIGKYVQENFWPVFRDSTIWLGLPVALTINGYGIPATVGGLDLRGYPTIVGADAAFRVVAGVAESKVSKERSGYQTPSMSYAGAH